ncbi:hypothetical protein EUA79_03080 [TM7 phylum sp. oral taxon 351]|nr:hypothetical protein EUA79_03080 [TM7 phylum sp. oral taxon 351]
MDQKNIGQVSGVNDRERQDFSGLNSLGVEQVPDGVEQMTSGDFRAEQVPTGLTQDEAVARLNQMFEAQGMPGANGFDRGQMAMGQMAMQAQMNGVSDQVQMNGVLNQTQMNSVPGQAQMNSVPEEMRIGGVSEGMQTGGVLEWVQMNSVSGQGQFEQVNPMQIHSEQIQGFENANSLIEQEKKLETERAEVEQGEEFSDEGVPKSDLGKIVTVGTRTFEDVKLKTIYATSDLIPGGPNRNLSWLGVFRGCVNLVGGNGSKMEESELSSSNWKWMRIDRPGTPGYLTLKK